MEIFMVQTLKKAADVIEDVLDKVQTPTSRAGHTVHRVAMMLENDVDPDVIALQMSKNSATGRTYTATEVKMLGKLYNDCKTKSPIKALQAKALIRDQKEDSQEILPVV